MYNAMQTNLNVWLADGSVVWGTLAWAAVAGSRQPQAGVLRVPELDAGFRLLYELKPVDARAQFAVRQKAHPDNPLGSAAEAASYLFEECYRQGILSSDFFLDDDRFIGKIPVKADPALRKAFFAASKRTRDLAEQQLKADPKNANALFAMTLSVGMEADYASLIDKEQLDSLRMIREADKFARKLLAVAPEAADAYLTLGTANYIIGSLVEIVVWRTPHPQMIKGQQICCPFSCLPSANRAVAAQDV